jgi:hypothetical protein
MASNQSVRHFEFCDEASADLRTHSLIESDEIAWCAISRQQDAPTGVENVFNRIEEFELSLGAPTEQLNVFDNQESDRAAISSFPILGATLTHGGDKLTGKLLRRRVDHAGRLAALSMGRIRIRVGAVAAASVAVPGGIREREGFFELPPMATRLSGRRSSEMSLPHARSPAEIELVQAPLSASCQGEGSLAGERIARAHHEALEAEGQLRLVGAWVGFSSGMSFDGRIAQCARASPLRAATRWSTTFTVAYGL